MEYSEEIYNKDRKHLTAKMLENKVDALEVIYD